LIYGFRKKSGSLAIFGSDPSRRVSGFAFSFEHLAVRLMNGQIWLVDHEPRQSGDICLSCGKAMGLARTIPAIGAVPELRTYDCSACGIVFTEGAGPAEWREI
jgi:hypothetical protein